MAIAALGFTAFETAVVATSVAATAASATLSVEASSRQAKAATQAADYNAALDAANAKQVALNANANIEKQRQDDATYQCDQRAALAASGVLSDTGSPMVVQATTAGGRSRTSSSTGRACRRRNRTCTRRVRRASTKARSRLTSTTFRARRTSLAAGELPASRKGGQRALV